MLDRFRETLRGLRASQHREAELARLRKRIDELERENERIRTAMRRCISCDYRLEVIGRNGGA